VLTNANIVAGSPAYDWGYHTDHAAVAMRARPADFARWAKRGFEGWSWDEARDH
jgi:choline dehydrogenase